ncbi:hypothetical protein HY633_00750 [Candidatus Uhrbacteria bacterium]|nr:hypothetical protein [Candidatus Uhrbacteria bacterium]
MTSHDKPSPALSEIPDENLGGFVDDLLTDIKDAELEKMTPEQYLKEALVGTYDKASIDKVIADLKTKGVVIDEAKLLPPKPAVPVPTSTVFNPPRIKGELPKFPDAPEPTVDAPPKPASSVAGPRIERPRDRRREDLPPAEYVIENRDRELVVVDRKFQKVKDGKGNEEVDDKGRPKREWKNYDTDIILPETVQEAYDRDSESPEVKQALATAQAIRQELEFDKKRKVQNLEAGFGADGWPVWKIKLGGYEAEESWDIKDFPSGLQRMAEQNGLDWLLKSNRFQEFVSPNSGSWNDWLNKGKRKAIERIISEELAEPKRIKDLKTRAVAPKAAPTKPSAPAKVEPAAPAAAPVPAAAPKSPEPKPPAPKIEPPPIVDEETKLYDEFDASLGDAVKTMSRREYAARFSAFRKAREPVAPPAAPPAAPASALIEKNSERRRYTPEQAARMKAKILDLRSILEAGMMKDNPRLRQEEAKEAADAVIKAQIERIDRATG